MLKAMPQLFPMNLNVDKEEVLHPKKTIIELGGERRKIGVY